MANLNNMYDKLKSSPSVAADSFRMNDGSLKELKVSKKLDIPDKQAFDRELTQFIFMNSEALGNGGSLVVERDNTFYTFKIYS